MKKLSEYTTAIDTVIQKYEAEIKEAETTLNKAWSNYRLSELGRQRARNEIIEAADKCTNKYNALLKAAISDFNNDYALKMPEDGKDHSGDLANALKVLELTGTAGLTADILRDILEPLKSSHHNIELIGHIIDAKSESGVNAPPADARALLNEYTGSGSGVLYGFNNCLEDIRSTGEACALSYDLKGFPDREEFSLMPHIPYKVYELAGQMECAHNLRLDLERTRGDLFGDDITTSNTATNARVIQENGDGGKQTIGRAILA